MSFLLQFSKFTIGRYDTEQGAHEARAERIANSPSEAVRVFLERVLVIEDTEASTRAKPFPRTLNELKLHIQAGGK